MQLYLSSGAYFLRNEVICTEELKNEELKMCSTAKSTIAIRIHRNDVFCHAELVSASRFYGKDSIFIGMTVIVVQTCYTASPHRNS